MSSLNYIMLYQRGFTALMWASISNSLGAVELLLSHGVNVNATDNVRSITI